MEFSIQSLFARTLERSADADSLVVAIAESIGRAIIEGQLYPGDDLNSVDLSRQFHTSRTPVREALLLLEKVGLVIIPPRRRPYVAVMSLSEAREIYQIRAHLHMLVSELIVAQASDQDIQRLQEQIELMGTSARADDRDGYFWHNLAFRATETAICGNVHLQQTLDGLDLRVLQLRHHALTTPGRLSQSYYDHARLLRAYEERDAPVAMALTRSLILSGLTAIEHAGWPAERHKQPETEMLDHSAI